MVQITKRYIHNYRFNIYRENNNIPDIHFDQYEFSAIKHPTFCCRSPLRKESRKLSIKYIDYLE